MCAVGYLGSVGYANTGHVETPEAVIDVLLSGNIQMSRALVQKENLRPSIECSREHHSLPLAA